MCTCLMERDTVLNGSASVFGKFTAFKLKPLNSSLLIVLLTDPIILQNWIFDFLVLLLLVAVVFIFTGCTWGLQCDYYYWGHLKLANQITV